MTTQPIDGTTATTAEGRTVRLDDADGVLVRIVPPGSLEQVVFRMDALHRLAARGVPVVNHPRAVETSVDKYLALVRMHEAGVPVPRTVVCEGAADAGRAFAELGGDVVIKPLFGSQGRGLMRVTDPELAVRALGVIERLGSVAYLQEFIAHPGWDVRVLVVGGRVEAAMRRRGRAGDWRTNAARGAEVEALTPDPDTADLAIRAAAAVGADLAGVDLIPCPGGGWVVPEVNAVPGWQALARCTGRDIAGAILRHVGDKCRGRA